MTLNWYRTKNYVNWAIVVYFAFVYYYVSHKIFIQFSTGARKFRLVTLFNCWLVYRGLSPIWSFILIFYLSVVMVINKRKDGRHKAASKAPFNIYIFFFSFIISNKSYWWSLYLNFSFTEWWDWQNTVVVCKPCYESVLFQPKILSEK